MTLRHAAGEAARSATDAFVMPRFKRSPLPDDVALIGIYRRRNAEHARALVDAVRQVGWTAAWWALDDVADDLAEHTVGQGSGEKFTLLNEIVERASLVRGWLLVADDDLVFVRGSPPLLVQVCGAAQFALAQPAQDASGWPSHEITVRRAVSIARATTFVEIGPLFVVAPSCRGRIVPFSPAAGMGWGMELEWSDLVVQGCRLGVVDAVVVKHVAPGG